MIVMSSETSEWPRSMRASAHSLFPTPDSPRSMTPTPFTSRVVACSIELEGNARKKRMGAPLAGPVPSEIELLAQVELARLLVLDQELARALGQHAPLV